jgi:DNA-binding response OmpR family regulator
MKPTITILTSNLTVANDFINLPVTILTKPIDYFRLLLTSTIDVLVVDVEFLNDTNPCISKFLSVNPKLIIISMVNPDLDHADKTTLINMGVNRTLNAPIVSEELFANINAIYRTQKAIDLRFESVESVESVELVDSTDSTDFNWYLSHSNWTLIAPDNQSMTLTSREFSFLCYIQENSDQVINKNCFSKKIFGEFNQHGCRKLDLILGRLRKKSLTMLNRELPIKTVHAVGYALTNKLLIRQ